MIAVSNDFKQAMKEPVKVLDGYLKLEDNTLITGNDDLISIKVSAEGGMGKTAMRKLEAKLYEGHNLLGKTLNVGWGVLINNKYEYLDYGSFKITEYTVDKERETISIVGYDNMLQSMIPYQSIFEYPMTLLEYAQAICRYLKLELGNTSFVHDDWVIDAELYENINGITFRDVLVEIAKVTASTCIIGVDNKVYFKYIEDTNETLTYDNLKKLKLEEEYGEINSVVLSRTPQEDNIYMRDEQSIEKNGLTEYKIENNQIIDKNREGAMTPIFNALKGIKYFPFNCNTEGLGWYEIGDRFSIIDKDKTVYSVVMFDFSIFIDSGIVEELKTAEPTKTQTQYQYATTIDKRLKNAEIIVDKQNNVIKSITSDVQFIRDEFGNYYTQEESNVLVQNVVDGLTNVFSNAGGNNLIQNSALFFGKENEYDFWTGNLKATEILAAITKRGFLLQKGIVEQIIQNLARGYFSLRFKFKKIGIGIGSQLQFEVNGNIYDAETDEGTIELTYENDAGTQNIKFLTNQSNQYIIYDLMLNYGQGVYLPYQQAMNELKSTTVQISESIRIESNISNTLIILGTNGLEGYNKSTGQLVFKQTDTGLFSTFIKTESAEISDLMIKKVGNQVWLTGLN